MSTVLAMNAEKGPNLALMTDLKHSFLCAVLPLTATEPHSEITVFIKN